MIELLIFFAISLGALFIVAAVFQVALEVRRLNTILQTQWNLEVVKTPKDIKYKKRSDKFEDV
tara:strand:- start:579 stop:767 length:189 start_codon:yes stop_codon:yes gene_type:complete